MPYVPLPARLQRSHRSRLASAALSALTGLTSVTLAAALSVPATALAQDEAAQEWQLASQPLPDALRQFAAQARIQLLFDEALAAGKTAPAVAGRLTARQALESLLAGSGLHALPMAGGFVVKAEAATSAVTLAPVVVTSPRERLYETRDVNAGALGARELKDLPFSIGSFTADTVENQRARTALDVLKNDPAVSPTTTGASYDGIAVRGFSANALQNVRRDGLLTNIYMDVPLENKERIDVLKGLSGFLHGVGEPSGVVNYVLKRPTRARFISVTGEVQSHDGLYANVDAGGPMGDGAVGYRLHAAAEKVGDFTHFGDRDRRFVGGAFDFKLGPDTLLQLDADWQKKALAASAVIGPRSDGVVVPAESFDPRTLLGQSWGRYTAEGSNFGARLEQALAGGWSWTTQIGYSRTTRIAAFPDVYSVAPNGDVLNGDYYYDDDSAYSTLSAQSLASGQWSTGPIRHDLVAGLGWSRLKTKDGDYVVLPDTLGNIYAPDRIPRPDLTSPGLSSRSTATQTSLFVSDTMSLTERWQLLAGLRHIHYHVDKLESSGAASHLSDQAPIPTAGVLFKPTTRTTLYATWTKGFEQGAYAPVWATNAGERLDPIESVQWEIGVKSQVTDGMLLSAAAFDIDKPLQEVGSDSVFRRDGRQHHRGLELTANGELVRGLNGIFGVAWLDAAQEGVREAAYEGKRPNYTAKFQANAMLDWRVRALPGLALNLGVYHVGNRPITRDNSVIAPGFTRWDGGASWATPLFGLPSVLRLAIENLADKRYWHSTAYGGVLQGNPRSVKLSLTSTF
jgi:iron complex outermembrane receptor protein